MNTVVKKTKMVTTSKVRARKIVSSKFVSRSGWFLCSSDHISLHSTNSYGYLRRKGTGIICRNGSAALHMLPLGSTRSQVCADFMFPKLHSVQ